MPGRQQVTGGLAPEDFSPESGWLTVPTKDGRWCQVAISRRLKLCGLPGFIAHRPLCGDTLRGRWVISHESGFAAGRGETIDEAKLNAEFRLTRSARINSLTPAQELARVVKLALEEQAAAASGIRHQTSDA